jgi:anti-sigma regulatory factor (Ser/Thr protein kinase)
MAKGAGTICLGNRRTTLEASAAETRAAFDYRRRGTQKNGTRLGDLIDYGSLLLFIKLPSNPELLRVVRGMMEGLTDVMGFSPPECRAVTIAVDEALANIIRHTYQARPGQPIEISCRRIQRQLNRRKRAGLEITLVDYGPAIDYAKLRGRMLDDIRPGGLGLHFIRKSMDTVKFTRAGRTNQLRLVKYLPERRSS